MREMNLALVLHTLRENGPLSRADLARTTGLQKATISRLVHELIEGGFVLDIGIDDREANKIGRPSSKVKINPEAGYIIGAEIGVNFISVILTDFEATILARKYLRSDNLSSQRAILGATIAALHEVSEKIDKKRPLFGIGVGLPGLVDQRKGNLLFAPNLHWYDVPIRPIIEQEFSVPVYVDNEANMAALGETYFGSGRNSDFLLYIVAGVGLGGGIVKNGRLLTGVSGLAGEFGHMTVNPGGIKCSCGNDGCWETVASERAIFRRVREAVITGKETILLDMTHGDLDQLTVSLVAEAACQQGDEVAMQAIRDTAYWLGIGIANLINAFNPQKVVIGGTLSSAHECMMPIVRDVTVKRALEWPMADVEIMSAENGADACVIGCIAKVYSRILSKPAVWLAS